MESSEDSYSLVNNLNVEKHHLVPSDYTLLNYDLHNQHNLESPHNRKQVSIHKLQWLFIAPAQVLDSQRSCLSIDIKDFFQECFHHLNTWDLQENSSCHDIVV